MVFFFQEVRMKVVYRQVDRIEIAAPLQAFDRGLKLDSVVVELGNGCKVKLVPVVTESPSRWILEKMVDRKCLAHYSSVDFCSWSPHPVETFDQRGIEHEIFGPSDLPAIESGDYLVLLADNGACAVFEVFDPEHRD
jgi:hypothetical protein